MWEDSREKREESKVGREVKRGREGVQRERGEGGRGKVKKGRGRCRGREGEGGRGGRKEECLKATGA